MTEEQPAQLDQSRWRNAGNSAEPINPRALEAPCEAFGPSGFQRRAICPIYGLAEATLLVSSPPSEDYVTARLGPWSPFWQRPQETFRAILADNGAGPFLRTGDLGFLRDGQVFVSGRLEDVIIRGVNHYPQDIEWTAQVAPPSLRPENGAPFSLMVDGEEKLAIVQEVEREYAPGLYARAVIEVIRRAVAN